jgi:hypothetical protein
MALFDTYDYARRTDAMLAEQERRVATRLRVMRLLKAQNDARFFRISGSYEAFAMRNAQNTLILLRNLRKQTYGI